MSCTTGRWVNTTLHFVCMFAWLSRALQNWVTHISIGWRINCRLKKNTGRIKTITIPQILGLMRKLQGFKTFSGRPQLSFLQELFYFSIQPSDVTTAGCPPVGRVRTSIPGFTSSVSPKVFPVVTAITGVKCDPIYNLVKILARVCLSVIQQFRILLLNTAISVTSNI